MDENKNYKEMYIKLFNSVTDIIESLKKVQEETERMYIESEENVEVREHIRVVKKKADNKSRA